MAEDEILQEWLADGRYTRLAGRRVRPLPHPIVHDQPLVIERGQATAVCLTADDKTSWVLKRFHAARLPDARYLRSIALLLPERPGLRCGTARQVLSSNDVTNGDGCFYCRELAEYLDGAVLMPRLAGSDWFGLAEEIRQGSARLTRCQRLALALDLVELVQLLENAGCVHRDLTGGNLYVDLAMGRVALIDFDSLYHASLSMPDNTTAGTPGYCPPYAFDDGGLSASRTWQPCGDRYALGLLVVELCILDQAAPLTGDGGMFSQDELCRCQGPGLAAVSQTLGDDWPGLESLFEAVIESSGFASCPSPEQWRETLTTAAGLPRHGSRVRDISKASFEDLLAGAAQAATPVWPAPELDCIEGFEDARDCGSATRLILPPDPWL